MVVNFSKLLNKVSKQILDNCFVAARPKRYYRSYDENTATLILADEGKCVYIFNGAPNYDYLKDKNLTTEKVPFNEIVNQVKIDITKLEPLGQAPIILKDGGNWWFPQFPKEYRFDKKYMKNFPNKKVNYYKVYDPKILNPHYFLAITDEYNQLIGIVLPIYEKEI